VRLATIHKSRDTAKTAPFGALLRPAFVSVVAQDQLLNHPASSFHECSEATA